MVREVFISYANEDVKIAEDACKYLEQKNITCWIAPRDITPGREYGEAIIDAIENSKALLLIFSEYSNESPHVLREVERAVSKIVPVIAYRISNTTPCKSMEYFLLSNQWLNATDKDNHYEELYSSIIEILGKEEKDEKEEERADDNIVPVKDNKKKSYPLLGTILIFASCLLIFLSVLFIYNNKNKGQVAIGGTDQDIETPIASGGHDNTDTEYIEPTRDSETDREHDNWEQKQEDEQNNNKSESGKEDPDSEEQSGKSDTQKEEPSEAQNQRPSVIDKVSVGDYIEFGAYEPQGYSSENADRDIIWLVIDINKEKNQLLLLSHKILDMKPYDVAESGVFDKDSEGNSYDRTIKDTYLFEQMIEFRGNSDWEKSNIRTWLNSDAARVTYKDREPIEKGTDEYENSYELEAGFLHGFTDKEKAMLCEREIITTLNGLEAQKEDKKAFSTDSDSIADTYDFSIYGTKTTKDKVFLLSLEEVQKYLYNNNLIIFAEPTQSAMDSDDSSYYFNSKYWPWSLRTPNGASAHEILAISAGISNTGDFRYYYAPACGLGIRPAITISLEQISFEGEGSKENPFIIAE